LKHKGRVFQIISYAFCAVFRTAIDGLRAAKDAHRRLQTENWGGTPVKVRLGIHAGSAELRGNDYHDYLSLVLVQRVISVASGGWVLLSNAMFELIHSINLQKG
jgi:class 3 adenylate cyclase